MSFLSVFFLREWERQWNDYAKKTTKKKRMRLKSAAAAGVCMNGKKNKKNSYILLGYGKEWRGEKRIRMKFISLSFQEKKKIAVMRKNLCRKRSSQSSFKKTLKNINDIGRNVEEQESLESLN